MSEFHPLSTDASGSLNSLKQLDFNQLPNLGTPSDSLLHSSHEMQDSGSITATPLAEFANELSNKAVFHALLSTTGSGVAPTFPAPRQLQASSSIQQDLLTGTPVWHLLVGIIDTGFAVDAFDLKQHHLLLGYDYIDNDANPLVEQDNEHGSLILDVIAASQKQDTDGEGNRSSIWLGRAIGSGRWADSLIEFVNTVKATGQTHAVVNLSFDLTEVQPNGSIKTRDTLTLQEWAALTLAQQNGVLVVAAAGNTKGAMSALGQASRLFDNLITVGAATGHDRAIYSSFGEALDLLAPGHTEAQAAGGTSIAAAQVTGAVSQLWIANPGLHYRQVISILKATATDLKTPGWDAETGMGLLNVAAAVELAKATPAKANHIEPDTLLSPVWQGKNTNIALERATDAGSDWDGSGYGSYSGSGYGGSGYSSDSDSGYSSSGYGYDSGSGYGGSGYGYDSGGGYGSDSGSGDGDSGSGSGGSSSGTGNWSVENLRLTSNHSSDPGVTPTIAWSHHIDSNYRFFDIYSNIDQQGHFYRSEWDVIRKYDGQRNQIWQQQLDADLYRINKLMVDAQGNLYSTGSIADTSQPDSYLHRDAFIAKHDGSGNPLWFRQFGNPWRDDVSAIALDQQGNVYLTGTTSNSFGHGFDAFVTKFDSEGNQVWMQQFGAPSVHLGGLTTNPGEIPVSISMDGQGNIYILGSTTDEFVGNETIGTRSSDRFVFISNDIFITKYDSNGGQQWLKQMGILPGAFPGATWENNWVIWKNQPGELVVGEQDNFYFTWRSVASGYSLDGDGTGIADFVAKYNGDGNQLWTKQVWTKDPNSDGPHKFKSYSSWYDWSWNPYWRPAINIAVDEDNSLYLADMVYRDADYRNGDITVTKYGGDGAELWQWEFGSPGTDELSGFTIAHENLYLFGESYGFFSRKYLSSNWSIKAPLPNKLAIVFDNTKSLLSPEKATVLTEQLHLFLEIGNKLIKRDGSEQAERYDLIYTALDEVLGGLYSKVKAAQTVSSELQGIAQEFNTFLASSGGSIEQLTFVTKLLYAATEIPELTDKLHNPDFIAALVELGKAYAALDPIASSTSTEPPLNFFLDTLWRAKDNVDIQKGAQELRVLIDKVNSPTKLLLFERDLLEAIVQIPKLQDHKQDTKFLKNLVELGSTYASLNPDTLSLDDRLNGFFLNTFWQQDKQGGSRQLEFFIERVDDPQRIVQFIQSLGESINQVIDTSDLGSTELTLELLLLGAAYAALNPSANSVSDNESPSFFLDTLWKQTLDRIGPLDSNAIEEVAGELRAFLEDCGDTTNQIDILSYLRKVLVAVKEVSAIREELRDPSRINELIESAILYAILTSAFDAEQTEADSLDIFFSEVWESKTNDELLVSANNLQAMISNASDQIAQAPWESLLLGLVRIRLPVTELPPQIPPPNFPTSLAGPLALLISIAVAARIIDAGPTAAPWQAEINPITRQPYQSEEEYRQIQLLTPEELNFLIETTPEQAQVIIDLGSESLTRWAIDGSLEIDEDSATNDDSHRRCIVGNISRGTPAPHLRSIQAEDKRRHNAYATYVTGSDFDYYVLEPEGTDARFDGRTPDTRTVWEVKAPRKDSLTTWLARGTFRSVRALARLDAQHTDDMTAASKCNFTYQYATASQGMSAFLARRWGYPVQYVPYPYFPYP